MCYMYYFLNLRNKKNTHGGVLRLVKLEAKDYLTFKALRFVLQTSPSRHTPSKAIVTSDI